jgi:hypothetical protein
MYVRKETAETNNRNIKASVCCTAVRLGSTRGKDGAPEKVASVFFEIVKYFSLFSTYITNKSWAQSEKLRCHLH